MNISKLAEKVFNNLSSKEVIEYACTAIQSLQEHDTEGEFNLHYTYSINLVRDFIINTLITNEINNGFRNKETGELIDNISSIQYGRIK